MITKVMRLGGLGQLFRYHLTELVYLRQHLVFSMDRLRIRMPEEFYIMNIIPVKETGLKVYDQI